MRRNSGFTLIELVIVLAIVAVLGAISVGAGRALSQAASFASGAWELSLKLSGLRDRALADAKDYLLVVVDASNANACAFDQAQCGKVIVYSSPQAGFTLAGFDPDAAVSGVSFEEDHRLPKNSAFDVASTWRPAAPFASVTAMSSAVLADCAGGRKCFGIRYRSNGEVAPEVPAPLTPSPAGFAFVMKPSITDSKAAERRAIFVSFPTGIVKTAAF